jgi:RimJ/RimL family protein N-acetyltransferase
MGIAPEIDRTAGEAELGYIDVDNHASHRVAQRCGYQREGVMRSIHVKQHQRIDAALWSRLPADPAPPRAR